MSNEELVALIRNGESERMGELWESVAGLVKWKAKRIMTALELRGSMCGVEFDDLVQCGYPAMVAAVNTYDPESGSFSTWLMYHLQNEFAEVTGYRTKRGRNEPLNDAFSLDKPLGEDGDSGLFGDSVPDQRATATMEAVEDRQYREQLHEAMEKALKVIPEDYSEVLRLRYYRGMALDEVGKLLGISGEQARQREGKGIRRLRNPSLAATLRPFYNFDFYCGTGLSAFRSSGLSVQERYLLKEEEQQQKAEARKQKREQRKREEKACNDFALSMEQLMADVEARIGAMTPEEKRALLDREEQRHR